MRAFTRTTPASWCRSDDPHDATQVLADICAACGVALASDRMAQVPCHSIGGNRSLVCQARALSELLGSPRYDSARWAYYSQRLGTGFVQGNKHEFLLAGAPAHRVRSAAHRNKLFRQLGYEETP